MRIKCGKVESLFLAVLLLSGAEPAWAVQQHGGSEGLISHQIGHLLFMAGMGLLLYRAKHRHLSGNGWTSFKIFLWLIFLWNVLTFSGHWMHEYSDPSKFSVSSHHITSFTITSLSDAYYYLTRLDHLLLVPAFLFLLLALRQWRHQ